MSRLPRPLKGYAKHPLRCRSEEHFHFLIDSQLQRKEWKFLYHMVKSYYDRMYMYILSPSFVRGGNAVYPVAHRQLRQNTALARRSRI